MIRAACCFSSAPISRRCGACPAAFWRLGESFTECVQREALEETGYHVEPTRLIGLYTSPEFDVRYPNGDEAQQFTVALECRIVGGRAQADETEVVQQCFCDLDEAPPLPPWYAAMVRDGHDAHGRLFRSARHRRFES